MKFIILMIKIKDLTEYWKERLLGSSCHRYMSSVDIYNQYLIKNASRAYWKRRASHLNFRSYPAFDNKWSWIWLCTFIIQKKQREIKKRVVRKIIKGKRLGKCQNITGKIVSSPDHGNHFDFQQIFLILPTFWTLPWYGNLLEVNFQRFGHFHGMQICWKSTSNFLDTSMVWKFVGSQLSTFWTLPWYKHFWEICWKYHGNLLEVEISMIWRGHDFSSV